MHFGETSLADESILKLLEYHHADMQVVSPPGTAYAFDIERLNAPDIRLFGAWEEGALLAVGALRSHKDFAEIKSMRAAREAAGRGAGKGLLAYMLEIARADGFHTVKLETGINPAFDAANGLYRSFGFAETEPFAGYQDNGDNRFYALSLSAAQ